MGHLNSAVRTPERNSPCPCGSRKKSKRCCMRAAPDREIRPDPDATRLAGGVRLHQEGRLGEAAAVYEAILRLHPDHADALHLLGLVAHQTGRPVEARDLLRRSLVENGTVAVWHANLGLVLMALAEFDEAAESFRRAATLDPELEDAHCQLGNALSQAGRLGEAIGSLSAAIGRRPHFSRAINHLGYLLEQTGNLERAAVCFRKAIAIDPEYAEAHNNLGNVLNSSGRFEEACESYAEAIRSKPDSPEAHSNLGNTLRARGLFCEAIESCRRAIELRPGYVEAHVNLGNALKDHGEIAEAIASYGRAIQIAPDHAKAHNNLAEALQQRGDLAGAIAGYRNALRAQPNFSDAYSNLLYLHAFHHDIAPEELRELARGWEHTRLTEAERRLARERAHPRSGTFSASPRAGRKLRLGIVSAELGSHAVAEFLQPVLEQIDRSRFHLTLFPTLGRTGERAAQIRSIADSFQPLIGVPDARAADRIRSEQIDVLVDTTGHTAGCRLGIFAHRAAPVQCTYIGYWSTTGLSEMDWHIFDPDCEPDCDPHFTEKLWRLPRINVCYRGETSLPESRWQPARDGTVALGSYNKYAKMREETLSLWAKVLHAIPDARLVLEDRTADDSEAHGRIETTLARLGVGPERIEFIPFIPGHARHMLLYDRLDIALDTIPFNSGTTAFDALWMGVPLVALRGTTVGSRMGSSVLNTLGRTEWIARTEAEYVQIVTALAADVELRKTRRANLRTEMAGSKLCDAAGLTRALEDAFESMYDQWLASA